MCLNAKEYAKLHGIKNNKIKKWFDSGYLGSATKDSKTGVYSIPEDTPVPYKADSRISSVPKLWKQILDAAQNCNSLFATMYPKLPDGAFERILNDFVEKNYIRLVDTKSGCTYLEILDSGYSKLVELNTENGKKFIERAERFINSGGTLLQALQLFHQFCQYVFV